MPSPNLSHPAIDAVLLAAATLLRMEVIFLGTFSGDTYTFDRVQTSNGWLDGVAGGQSQRSDTFCHRMLSGAEPSTADAEHDPAYRDTPARLEHGITAYVGVPVLSAEGEVLATLCGVDRSEVAVNDDTLAVLRQLAAVVATHLTPLISEGVVIRRGAGGSWAVGDEQTGDLTSAMVLADLLAGELPAGARPARSEVPLDEVAQLRLSVTQLEHALAARVVVEQAIGVLTERQRSSPREAFERLRKVARARGRKVHDLAKEVVASSHDQSVPLPPELAGRL